ncbi:MAG: autotransporter outer membrane beta-barrel domain-containing protein [Desulfovibrio sp.]|nr:autotransporter outer membrane beta-barrel domain-containing protein [Desulfovibrio sp.]
MTINGGTVIRVSYGASISINGGYASSGNATGNSVYISGGTVTSIVGDSRISGGYAPSGNATGNSVHISGGTVDIDVYGGYAPSGNATGNSVYISGGTVEGNVCGGSAPSGNATGNSVHISGKPDLTQADLAGGVGSSLSSLSDNTLYVHDYQGTAVKKLANFDKFSFILPAGLRSGGTALEVTDTASFTLPATIITNISQKGGTNPLAVGSTVNLIKAGSFNSYYISTINPTASGLYGATLRYDWDVKLDMTAATLTATLKSVSVNPQAKALAEGAAAGAALINQGADMAAGKGMDNAVSAAKGGGAAGGGALASFGALSAGQSRYNSGSHVDVSSLSLLVGLSRGVELAPGWLTLGAFFEFGRGSYNTYNSFSNAASVDGDGASGYMGVGLLGRLDFIPTGPGNFYTEASARLGSAHNRYDNSDLRDAAGRSTGFDTYHTPYVGLHLGAGYVWNITPAASLDMYGKYFWTRQYGQDVALYTGETLTFDDADSHRLRFGGRFSYAVNEYVSPYAGAAWEHEFDGRVRSAVAGYDIDAPSLRGDTGMGELGLTLRPSTSIPLSVDVGVQGYTGIREGVTGSVMLKLEF